MIIGLNHANVVSADMAQAARFYNRLGFEVGFRPEGFPDPGMWMYQNGKPLVHINPRKEEDQGPIHHFAFDVRGSVDEVGRWLWARGLEPEIWDAIPGAHRAMYVQGAAGEKIEFVLVDVPIL